MPRQADITSVEALETFRSRLIVYRNQAGLAVDEVREEIVRTRLWLQNEQRLHWEREVRRRARDLEQARQQRLSDRLFAGVRGSHDAEQDVHRAERAVQAAEEKLRLVMETGRQYDSRVELFAKGVDRLYDVVTGELPMAVAFLTQAIKSLQAYADALPGVSPGRNEPGEPTAKDVALSPPAAPGATP